MHVIPSSLPERPSTHPSDQGRVALVHVEVCESASLETQDACLVRGLPWRVFGRERFGECHVCGHLHVAQANGLWWLLDGVSLVYHLEEQHG